MKNGHHFEEHAKPESPYTWEHRIGPWALELGFSEYSPTHAIESLELATQLPETLRHTHAPYIAKPGALIGAPEHLLRLEGEATSQPRWHFEQLHGDSLLASIAERGTEIDLHVTAEEILQLAICTVKPRTHYPEPTGWLTEGLVRAMENVACVMYPKVDKQTLRKHLRTATDPIRGLEIGLLIDTGDNGPYRTIAISLPYDITEQQPWAYNLADPGIKREEFEKYLADFRQSVESVAAWASGGWRARTLNPQDIQITEALWERIREKITFKPFLDKRKPPKFAELLELHMLELLKEQSYVPDESLCPQCIFGYHLEYSYPVQGPQEPYISARFGNDGITGRGLTNKTRSLSQNVFRKKTSSYTRTLEIDGEELVYTHDLFTLLIKEQEDTPEIRITMEIPEGGKGITGFGVSYLNPRSGKYDTLYYNYLRDRVGYTNGYEPNSRTPSSIYSPLHFIRGTYSDEYIAAKLWLLDKLYRVNINNLLHIDTSGRISTSYDYPDIHILWSYIIQTIENNGRIYVASDEYEAGGEYIDVRWVGKF